MKIYDISVPVSPSLAVWPGDSPISIKRVSKIEDGANANVSQIMMSAHTGTHVDAPYHFLAEGVTLENVPLKRMIGPAYVLHLPEVDLITDQVLARVEIPDDTTRLLFKTHNSKFWLHDHSKFQTDFVALSPDGAQCLVDHGIKTVGIDYLSIAPYKNSRPTHEILLKAGVFILEGVDLSEVSQGNYTLYCLPLHLQGVDGAPARAVLVQE